MQDRGGAGHRCRVVQRIPIGSRAAAYVDAFTTAINWLNVTRNHGNCADEVLAARRSDDSGLRCEWAHRDLPRARRRGVQTTDGQEIRTKIIGRDITDGVHWSWYFRPDGALISMELAKRRVGSWKIEDNKLCREKEKGKQIECYDVAQDRQLALLLRYAGIRGNRGAA